MNSRTVLFLISLLVSSPCFANDGVLNKDQQHVDVSMRMIGHQVLLSVGDSTSRVLPIEKKKNDKYQIRFENKLAFNPDNVALVIDSVIASTKIATSYIVEFESCETKEIVHAYEIGETVDRSVLACRTRDQPLACYNLLITILNNSESAIKAEPTDIIINNPDEDYTEVYKLLALLIICVVLLFVIVKVILNRNSSSPNEIDASVISIGKYKFNKRKMELWFDGERIELTSKECDLLQLLCDSTNNTVERETILKMVWGDDGDYVGRTLDVFISKLRKKLEGDSNVRITNIRGIGYKLIVDS